MFPVSAQKEKDLAQRMKKLNVREEDIEESFVRSSGAGGQNVNKTSTCVVLHHLLTGIKVKCQIERSQALNRFHARKILLDKIEKEREGRLSAEQKRIEKIRRQKRKSSRRAKLKVLEEKSHQAKKKSLRNPCHSKERVD
ncbi:MAG: peptide chain release factor family protein [Nitrospiria bacterium]